jgi:hypothetical protein
MINSRFANGANEIGHQDAVPEEAGKMNLGG